ncbi:hypothetical protein C5167_009010, partial [Papaver somniferum]
MMHHHPHARQAMGIGASRPASRAKNRAAQVFCTTHVSFFRLVLTEAIYNGDDRKGSKLKRAPHGKLGTSCALSESHKQLFDYVSNLISDNSLE